MVISETDFELLFENLSNKQGNNIWPNRLFEGMQLTYELYFLGLPKKKLRPRKYWPDLYRKPRVKFI